MFQRLRSGCPVMFLEGSMQVASIHCPTRLLWVSQVWSASCERVPISASPYATKFFGHTFLALFCHTNWCLHVISCYRVFLNTEILARKSYANLIFSSIMKAFRNIFAYLMCNLVPPAILGQKGRNDLVKPPPPELLWTPFVACHFILPTPFQAFAAPTKPLVSPFIFLCPEYHDKK